MRRRFDSELATTMYRSMKCEDIDGYAELVKVCGLKTKNTRFCDVLGGKQKICEEDLLKISKKLKIPMEFFRRHMACEIKYYVPKKLKTHEKIKKEIKND